MPVSPAGDDWKHLYPAQILFQPSLTTVVPVLLATSFELSCCTNFRIIDDFFLPILLSGVSLAAAAGLTAAATQQRRETDCFVVPAVAGAAAGAGAAYAYQEQYVPRLYLECEASP
jgi:hypothetical protein